jgi:hypothetical protein
MAERILPAGFEDLDPFAAHWALPTQAARREKRLASNMDEIHGFYKALLPRVEAIAKHFGSRPIDQLAAGEQRLLSLAFMFMAVAPAVEIFGQPEVRGNTFPYQRFFEADPITGRSIVGERTIPDIA